MGEVVRVHSRVGRGEKGRRGKAVLLAQWCCLGGEGERKGPARNEWDGYGSEGLAASYRFGLSTIWPGRWLASFWGERAGPCELAGKRGDTKRRHRTRAKVEGGKRAMRSSRCQLRSAKRRIVDGRGAATGFEACGKLQGRVHKTVSSWFTIGGPVACCPWRRDE